ncbi:MAG: hypothetical protein WEC84_04860 [Candidatus Andersenbacteria bacterium]
MESLPLLAVFFVIVGSLIRASRKVWTKWFQESEHPKQWKTRPAALTAVQMSVASATFFIWAALTGGSKVEGDPWVLFYWVVATGVLSVFNMYARTALQGLKGITLSAPIEALVPLGALIIGPLMALVFPMQSWRRFPLDVWGITGVVIMVIGVYRLNLRAALADQGNVSTVRLFTLLRRNSAFVSAILVVTLGAIGVNLEAEMANRASIPWVLAWTFLITALGNYGMAWRGKEFSGLPLGAVAWAAVPGMLFALGNGVTNYAYRYANTAYVAGLKRSDVIFSLLGGWLINKEREELTRRVVAGTLIAIGAALILVGMRPASP